MPGPAARIGDQTAHGGVIVGPGCPTVLIGGKPAASMGDMHTCPMQTPAAPSPIPHVGGPVLGPGVPTVLIGNKPAITCGDTCICVGPPDAIIPPGEPTVLIGTGGGGGGGGGGAGGLSSTGTSDAVQAGATGDSSSEILEGDDEDHYLDVKVVDKGGFPISNLQCHVTGPGGFDQHIPVAGRIRISGIDAGSYDLKLKAFHNAQWSESEAEVGQQLTLTAEASGFEDGTPAEIVIYLRDINRPDDELTILQTEVSGGRIESEWEFAVNQELLDLQAQREEQGGYSCPKYYFVVRAEGCEVRSGILKFKDWIEIRLTDKEGEAVADRPYQLILPTGEIREGSLDGEGKAREENIPPGRIQVRYDVRTQSSGS